MVTEFIMVGKACGKGMLTEKVERMNGTFSSMLSLFHSETLAHRMDLSTFGVVLPLQLILF